jgi:adenine-specific DNA-methyltransferase
MPSLRPLQQHADFVDRQGQLDLGRVLASAQNYDATLLALLLSDALLRGEFFVEVAGSLIFKLEHFVQFLQQLSAQDAMSRQHLQATAGLKSQPRPRSNGIVLTWPYKGYLLEGGQSRLAPKKPDIFLHPQQSAAQIEQLLSPKLLCNAKQFSASGPHNIDFRRNADGQIRQNLIIKGDNLVVMHSLKPQFAAQVQLVYIDPPYNTGTASFLYRDAFSHATWLTFMKNRAEAALALMAPAAVFIAHCSFHQYAHLRLVLDEIFAKHLCDFHIQVRHPERHLTSDKEFNDLIEYVLIYSNDAQKKMPYQRVEKRVDAYEYQMELIDPRPAQILTLGKKTVEVYLPNQYRAHKTSAGPNGLKKISIRGSIREKNSSGRFFVQYIEPLSADFPAQSLFRVPEMGDDVLGYRDFYTAAVGRKNGGYFQGLPQSSGFTKKPYANFYNFERAYNGVAKQGGVSYRNGKKPEQLLKFLMGLFSRPGDLVLDYHLGSGSTAATAHKLGRRYIGIEQLAHAIDIILKRLQGVLQGESSGISQDADVNWQGGGEFAYLELKSLNAQCAEQILATTDRTALGLLWLKIQAQARIHHPVACHTDPWSQVDFQALDLAQQQQRLLELLEQHQLYINLAALQQADPDFSLEDQSLSQQFYQGKG